MMKPSIDVVVILAAGFGSRLKSDQGPPKPLLPLAGRPLITRVMDCFAEAGVREAVVVLGHRADEVRAGIESTPGPLQVTFVTNPRYDLSNGLSVLAARAAVGQRPFFISMSDHIFDASLIRSLLDAPLPADGLLLGVDRKLDEVFDMDDATKVLEQEGRIVEIHKELEHYNAIDTGLFACTTTLFDAIEAASSRRADGDCSLSDGVKTLSAAGTAMVCDIGEGHWQDVDTPGALAHALKLFGLDG